MDSDEELMTAYARGDPAAFDALFARYEGRAYAFLLRRVRSPDLAADLFQELFLRVHRGRETFRAEGRFAPWFFQVARNVLVDQLRRRGPALEEWRDDIVRSEVASPEAAFAEREALAALLRDLSEEERVIVVAAKGAGVDLPTIARALGRTTAAVKQIVSRARRRLRAARRGSVTGKDDRA